MERKGPKSSVKSGVKEEQYADILGGIPPKKTVEQIEKENAPKDAPKAQPS